MRRFLRGLVTGLVTGIAAIGMAQGASAQIANAALGEAKARLACGTGTVVASVFLPNGSLQVTCAQAPSNAASSAVQATGLTTTAAVSTIGIVTVLVAITGGGDPGTTTTTTEPGSDGGGDF